MTEKYKILGQFIKDLSSETKDVETYLHVRDNISKYKLDINIYSKALKNKIIEINTVLKFEDKEETKFKSFFEMVYTTIIQLNEEIENKIELEKIILCDVQLKISSDLEKSFLDLLRNSGYSNINFEKKIDFEELYKKRIN
tara:strand:- start:1142 stop:1564 length:423 start_codon:yes stop_codon:yes gene_type:complete